MLKGPNKTNKLKVFFARSIFLVSMIEPDFNLQLSPKLLKWQYFKCEQIQSQALSGLFILLVKRVIVKVTFLLNLKKLRSLKTMESCYQAKAPSLPPPPHLLVSFSPKDKPMQIAKNPGNFLD